MAEPLTPKTVVDYKAKTMPDKVMECWNDMIALKYISPNESFIINQDEIVKALMVATGEPRYRIFEKGWLDTEEIYRAAGWCVRYEKPAYNESGTPFFVFKGIMK